MAAGKPDDEPIYRQVGRAIARHREQRRLTQEELAARLNTSAAWLSQIERAHGKASLGMLARIAEALDVPLIALLIDPAFTLREPDFEHVFQQAVATMAQLTPRDLRTVWKLINALELEERLHQRDD